VHPVLFPRHAALVTPAERAKGNPIPFGPCFGSGPLWFVEALFPFSLVDLVVRRLIPVDSSAHNLQPSFFLVVSILACLPLMILGAALEGGAEPFLGGLTWQAVACAGWEATAGTSWMAPLPRSPHSRGCQCAVNLCP
jgi:hypothetical protein